MLAKKRARFRLEVIECWGLFDTVRVRKISTHRTIAAAAAAMNALPEKPEEKGKKGVVTAPYARISYDDYHDFFGKTIQFICAYHGLLHP